MLIIGQTAAFVGALTVFFLEFRRLRRVSGAALEACRLWCFMAASVLTVWFAISVPSDWARAMIAVASPVLTALIVNNAYSAFKKREISDVFR